jgi:hypothetical protein
LWILGATAEARVSTERGTQPASNVIWFMYARELRIER